MRRRRTSVTPPRPPRGFTIVELMTVLVVVAIVAALAGPSMQSILIAQRLRAAGTDLVSSLLLARSEAIKRNANVTVQPVTGTDWTTGWRVVSSAGEQIDRKGELGNRVAVTQSPGTIVYNPSGRLATAGTARIELADANHDPAISSRCVAVDTSGVPKLAPSACP